MSSSDSDAFESADEDVIETKIPNKTKLGNQLHLEDKQNVLAKHDEVIVSTLENQSIPILVDNINVGTKITKEVKKNEPIIEQEKDINDGEMNFSGYRELPVAPPSIMSSESSCELLEIDDVKELEPLGPDSKADEDMWSLGKWEDDIEEEINDLVSKSVSPQLKDSTLTTNITTDNVMKMAKKTEPETQVKEFEEDGWQFDEWDNDDTWSPVDDSHTVKKSQPSQEGITSVLDKISTAKPQESTNWGWTPWGGMVQLLSTATSHVSSVIESGIGAIPNPEEIARLQHEENLKKREQDVVLDNPKDEKSMLLGNIMSGVSLIGNRVLAGGLDTLEGIGKKTMTILQENDPGLLNKRKMLGMMDKESPVLSQILREAKEKTEETERNMKEIQKQRYKKQLHFETLFDDYHGLVHLEALEMLSQQSALKLQALLAPLTGIALSDLEETLSEVKELCELPEMDNEDSDELHTTEELSNKFKKSVEDLDITVDFKEIIQSWADNILWLEDESSKSSQEIHDKALRCLAQTTAISINKMHKLAELILIKDHHSTADEADSLVQITSVICGHLSGIASRFGNSLSEMENKDEVNTLITSIFMEGSNSTSYVQNAFQLLIPILQMGAA